MICVNRASIKLTIVAYIKELIFIKLRNALKTAMNTVSLVFNINT